MFYFSIFLKKKKEEKYAGVWQSGILGRKKKVKVVELPQFESLWGRGVKCHI
jgi:hypothetical protein